MLLAVAVVLFGSCGGAAVYFRSTRTRELRIFAHLPIIVVKSSVCYDLPAVCVRVRAD